MSDPFVYCAWSGEYEQRMLLGIARTVEDAVDMIKAPYGEPYIVRWDAVKRITESEYELTGHFKAVKGFCGDGPQTWEILREKIFEPAPLSREVAR